MSLDLFPLNADGLPSLWTPGEVQLQLRDHLLELRKRLKISRARLAEMTGVPSPTIRHFEMTAQISLRQFLLIWGYLGELEQLREFLIQKKPRQIQSFKELRSQR